MHLIVNSKCYITRYRRNLLSLFFFFNDTATTEIYTLSLHDALPICRARRSRLQRWRRRRHGRRRQRDTGRPRSPQLWRRRRRRRFVRDRSACRWRQWRKRLCTRLVVRMSKQDLHFALIKADRVHNIIVADEEFIAELQTRQPSLWDSIEPVAGECAIGSVKIGRAARRGRE